MTTTDLPIVRTSTPEAPVIDLTAPRDEQTATPDLKTSPPPAPAAPTEPPARARTPRRRFDGRRWMARFAVVAMAGGAVYGGLQVVQYRTAQATRLSVGTMTLTAQPTPVSTIRAGVVSDVAVRAQQKVTAGERLGTLTTTTPNAAGKLVTQKVALTAPADGVLVSDPLPAGSSLQPGQTFVQLYDPAQLTLTGEVAISTLTHLSKGMTATLTGPGLTKPVTAKVDRAVPFVQDDIASTAGRLQLVMLPTSAASVTSLVPGYQFQATVTADPDTLPADGGVLAGH